MKKLQNSLKHSKNVSRWVGDPIFILFLIHSCVM
jgi:hypothetical protein